MVSGPGGVSSTPTINFKPDPGEPAVRLSAKEQQTAGLVTAQEQRNETRLRSRALVRGDEVVFSNRTFDLQVGQRSPVFSGGLTSVATRTDPNGAAPDSIFVPGNSEPNALENSEEAEGEESNAVGESEEEDELAPESSEDAVEKTEEELEEEERELETEDARLERSLNQARLQQELALESGNPAQLEAARREEQELEREREEAEKEQREVELERLEKQLEESTEIAGEAITENLEAAGGLLGVLFGFGGGEDQEENQTAGAVPNATATRPIENTFFARNRPNF